MLKRLSAQNAPRASPRAQHAPRDVVLPSMSSNLVDIANLKQISDLILGVQKPAMDMATAMSAAALRAPTSSPSPSSSTIIDKTREEFKQIMSKPMYAPYHWAEFQFVDFLGQNKHELEAMVAPDYVILPHKLALRRLWGSQQNIF